MHPISRQKEGKSHMSAESPSPRRRERGDEHTGSLGAVEAAAEQSYETGPEVVFGGFPLVTQRSIN